MRARVRSSAPAVCDCQRVRHEHGTYLMYLRHHCGCDACAGAKAALDAQRRRATEVPDGLPGLFVATFPFYGGWSLARLHRALRPAMAELAEEQGVRLLAGDLRFRVDRTGAGVFVSAAVPAVSTRADAEVRMRAEEFVYEHALAHPRLAAATYEHLKGEAA